MDFKSQYKHPLWQKKRLEVMKYNDFQCEDCGDTESQLNVHHPIYRKGMKIWEYEREELKCLCDRCHEKVHAIDNAIKEDLVFVEIKDRIAILGFVSRLMSPSFIKDDYSREYLSGIILASIYNSFAIEELCNLVIKDIQEKKLDKIGESPRLEAFIGKITKLAKGAK